MHACTHVYYMPACVHVSGPRLYQAEYQGLVHSTLCILGNSCPKQALGLLGVTNLEGTKAEAAFSQGLHPPCIICAGQGLTVCGEYFLHVLQATMAAGPQVWVFICGFKLHVHRMLAYLPLQHYQGYGVDNETRGSRVCRMMATYWEEIEQQLLSLYP